MLDLPVPCPYGDEHNEGLFLRSFRRGVMEGSDLPGGDVESPPRRFEGPCRRLEGLKRVSERMHRLF